MVASTLTVVSIRVSGRQGYMDPCEIAGRGAGMLTEEGFAPRKANILSS